MSYDLYCYRPTSSRPDPTEAEGIIERFNEAEESGSRLPTTSSNREQIAGALIALNPRLKRFEFDFVKIADSMKVSEDEARARFTHIELDPEEDDLAIQLIVHDDYVFASIPYWYKGREADAVFLQLSKYLRVIRVTAGLFAYDPQTGTAFDPLQTELRDHQIYDEVVEQVPKIAAGAMKPTNPWWKLW